MLVIDYRFNTYGLLVNDLPLHAHRERNTPATAMYLLRTMLKHM